MFINFLDAQIFTVEFGRGPRVFVGHDGWVGSWELWCEPFTQLSKTWRAIAYDHLGTGATIAAADSISFEALAADPGSLTQSFGRAASGMCRRGQISQSRLNKSVR